MKENTKDAIGRKEEEKEGDGDGDEKTVAGDAKMDNGCTDLAEAIAASGIQTTEGHTTTTRNSDNSISGEEEAIARAVEASMLDGGEARRPIRRYQIMTGGGRYRRRRNYRHQEKSLTRIIRVCLTPLGTCSTAV